MKKFFVIIICLMLSAPSFAISAKPKFYISNEQIEKLVKDSESIHKDVSDLTVIIIREHNKLSQESNPNPQKLIRLRSASLMVSHFLTISLQSMIYTVSLRQYNEEALQSLMWYTLFTSFVNMVAIDATDDLIAITENLILSNNEDSEYFRIFRDIMRRYLQMVEPFRLPEKTDIEKDLKTLQDLLS